MLRKNLHMRTEVLETWHPSTAELETCVTLGSGTLLLLYGVIKRSPGAACLAFASAPLLYRGFTGRWPAFLTALEPNEDTHAALGGDRGLHVREAVRLEIPIADVYQFWRRLENLPRFLLHLDSVRQTESGRSHWVATGPAGMRVEWDAEIINEVENQVIGWRSLPGGDVVTAGSVNFDAVRDGRITQVTVHLQYAPPAGNVGAFVASLFGRAPSQTIREDLRRFKQLLEAGEIARASGTETAR
jgi:uncharacterized membrane protein